MPNVIMSKELSTNSAEDPIAEQACRSLHLPTAYKLIISGAQKSDGFYKKTCHPRPLMECSYCDHGLQRQRENRVE